MLHSEDKVMVDPGEMAQTMQEHSQKVAQGWSHDGAAVNDYLRGTLKPRNWKRLPELVPVMTMKEM